MKTQIADSGAAGAVWAEEGAYLADRHEQRFTRGTRQRLQIPAYPRRLVAQAALWLIEATPPSGGVLA